VSTIAIEASGVSRAKPQARAGKGRGRVRTVNLVPWILLILTFTMGCLLYVQSRTSVINERYLLEQAKHEKARLRAENRRLRLSWATLTSPEQIEKAARDRFHLHYPSPTEIVRMP
jgi:cell division protein FtsL